MRIAHFEPWMKDDVCQLIISIQRDEFGILNRGVTGTLIQLSDQPDLLALPDSYLNGHGGFWVALEESSERPKIIGTIGLMDAGQATYALRKMFVDPKFRGTRSERGKVAPSTLSIAQQLMDVAIQHTREHRYNRILLGTLERYIAAQKFYERNGFSVIAADDLPAHFPRAGHDTKFYDLRL